MAKPNKGGKGHNVNQNQSGKGKGQKGQSASEAAQEGKLQGAAAINKEASEAGQPEKLTGASGEAHEAKAERMENLTGAAAQAHARATGGNGNKNYSEEYRRKMTALPVHLRTTTKLRRALERMEGYIKQASRFDEEALRIAEKNTEGKTFDPTKDAPSVLIAGAEAGLTRAIAMLEAIPEDYEPPRKLAGAAAARAGGATTSGGNIKPGMTVQIREKRRAAYADDLTAEEMEKLLVHETRKNKVVCVTPGGGKVFIPKAHLSVVGEATLEADNDENEDGEEAEATAETSAAE